MNLKISSDSLKTWFSTVKIKEKQEGCGAVAHERLTEYFLDLDGSYIELAYDQQLIIAANEYIIIIYYLFINYYITSKFQKPLV